MVTGLLNLQIPPHAPEEGSVIVPHFFFLHMGFMKILHILKSSTGVGAIEGRTSAVMAITLVWIVIISIFKGNYIISFSSGFEVAVFGYVLCCLLRS